MLDIYNNTNATSLLMSNQQTLNTYNIFVYIVIVLVTLMQMVIVKKIAPYLRNIRIERQNSSLNHVAIDSQDDFEVGKFVEKGERERERERY